MSSVTEKLQGMEEPKLQNRDCRDIWQAKPQLSVYSLIQNLSLYTLYLNLRKT